MGPDFFTKAFGLAALVLAFSSLLGCSNSDFAGGAARAAKNEDDGRKKVDEDDDDDNDSSTDGPDAGDADNESTKVDPALGTETDKSGMVLGNIDEDEAKSFVPRFALLINDIECGFCHTQVHGDIVSTSAVPAVRDDTVAKVKGAWYAASTFTPPSSKVDVSGGVTQNHTGKPLPNDLDGDGKADFPTFSPSGIEDHMKGSVKTKDKKISKTHSGNVVLIGTESDPIEIEGEVLIRGDVVIKGVYDGIGNIYATGNIYVPGDLKAENSAFPFSEDPSTALSEAKQRIKSKRDALALATKKSILVGDILPRTTGSIFDHGDTPADMRSGAIGLNDVFNWYPGGQSGFESLYSGAPEPCMHGGFGNFNASISLIEAYLYAEGTVGGMARNNSYAINGGVIAKNFHIVSAAQACPAGTHAVHKLDKQWSHINYDYRMKAGLLLLKQLYKYFK